MDVVFDPDEHEEFTKDFLANEKHFDEIEAEYYTACKVAGDMQGIVLQLHICVFVLNQCFILSAVKSEGEHSKVAVSSKDAVKKQGH